MSREKSDRMNDSDEEAFLSADEDFDSAEEDVEDPDKSGLVEEKQSSDKDPSKEEQNADCTDSDAQLSTLCEDTKSEETKDEFEEPKKSFETETNEEQTLPGDNPLAADKEERGKQQSVRDYKENEKLEKHQQSKRKESDSDKEELPRPNDLWGRKSKKNEKRKPEKKSEECEDDPSNSKTPVSIAKNEEEEEEEMGDDGGWDVDDWGDLEEEPMVTPGTGLPPANPDWARMASPAKESSLFSPLDRLASSDSSTGGNLWGGFNSLLSTVGEGFTSVMENTLGVPNPEELARMSLMEREELQKKADEVKEPWPSEDRDDCDSAEELGSEGGSDAGVCVSEEGSSGYQSDSTKPSMKSHGASSTIPSYSGLFSGVSSAFENTGRTLVGGSLGALEFLGKKTFEVLTDTDKETQRRKFILSQEKPSLSKIMKELKEKGEAEDRVLEEEMEARKSSFPYLFESYQGLVNYEALEMLSKSCSKQLEVALKSADIEIEVLEKCAEIQGLFEKTQDSESFSEEEDHNFVLLFKEELKKLNLEFRADKIFEIQCRRREWVKTCSAKQILNVKFTGKEIYQQSIECLAELSAAGIELFLKIGQLLLISNSNSLAECQSLTRLLQTLVQELGISCAKYSSCLSTAADQNKEEDSLNSLITQLFLEGNNSSSYVNEAFQLLLPVLQCVVTKSSLPTIN